MAAQKVKKTRTARENEHGLTNPFASGNQPIDSTSNQQDKDEVYAELFEICKRIDLFFTAMKLL